MRIDYIRIGFVSRAGYTTNFYTLGGYAPTTNPLPFVYHFNRIKYCFRIHAFNRERVPLSHTFTASLYQWELSAKKGSFFVISV